MIYISNSIYLALTETVESIRNKPMICYHSVYKPGTTTASVGMGASSIPTLINIWSPDTYTFFQSEVFLSEQYIDFFNSEGGAVNYLAIAAHNMGHQSTEDGSASWGFSYQIRYWNGSTWVNLTSLKLPADNNVIIEYFDDVTTDHIRIYFNFVYSGTPPADTFLRIAHVKIGRALFLQKRTFVGVKPYTMDVSYEGLENVSDNGNYLGSYVTSQSQNWSIKQDYNSPDHVRLKIIPFIKHMSGDGDPQNGPPFTFFAAWRPDDYPKECLYCWKPLKSKVVPEITGRNGLMAWEASGKGIK